MTPPAKTSQGSILNYFKRAICFCYKGSFLSGFSNTIQTVNDANLRSIEAKEVADAAAALADEAKTAAVDATTSAQNAVATAADAAATAADAAAAAAAVQNSVGESEGIAPLDVFGKVPLANLPEISADTKPVILEFSGFEPLWSDDVTLAASVLKSTDEDCRVLFDGTHFFLKHEPNGQGPVMFWRWADAEAFGEKVGQGVNYKIAPRPNCIYVNKLTGEMYRVEGSALVPIASNMIPVTYDQLVELRGQEALKPGMWYRITDYVTTVANDPEARSVGNPFDVLVLATGPGSLSEEARAAHSERDVDGYFANANIDAWKVWYCLDNDTTRFQWADDDEGKGVIYRLIDEWNNDCPYDFKNIQFKRYPVDCSFYEDYLTCDEPFCPVVMTWSLDDSNLADLCIDEGSSYNIEWFYTFSLIDGWNNVGSCAKDASLRDAFDSVPNTYDSDDMCHDNIMAPYRIAVCFDTVAYKVRALNNIVLFTEDKEDDASYRMSNNIWEVGCYDMTLAEHCGNNRFGCKCFAIIAVHASGNEFGFECYNTAIGYGSDNNIFGAESHNNIVGLRCRKNRFGVSSHSNWLYHDCDCNTFGDYCCSNELYESCCCNKFGDGCEGMWLEEFCKNNEFGQQASCNDMFRRCLYNVLGANVRNCIFGGDNYGNMIGPDADAVSICPSVGNAFIHPGVRCVSLSSGMSRTVVFNPGSPSTSSVNYDVTSSILKGSYCTKFAGVNSAGELKVWNPADLVE